jgi:hypothetical protein
MFGPCYLPATHADVRHIAVALGRMGRNNEYAHSLLLYRDQSKQVKALDFNLAGDITSSDPIKKVPRFAWAVPQLHDTVLPQVAAYCESIGTKPRRFTYQFAFDEQTSLARLGQNDFIIEGGKEGFTCATFILAIFQALQFPIAKIDTWVSRQEDGDWQKETLELLRKQKGKFRISDEALNRRANEIPCMRFTPSDVIGACRAGNHPTHCDSARKAGDEALRWVDGMLRMVNS